MSNNETYTLRNLIARLDDRAAKAPGGMDAPVYIDAGDRQYGIDTVDVETDPENGPGVWLIANDETVDL